MQRNDDGTESVAERIARLDRAGAFDTEPSAPFELEPTEPRTRGAQKYLAEKGRKHVRRVRSPRFSDDEFRDIETQAGRLRSIAAPGTMTALEFVREASCELAKVVEALSDPLRVWDLLREMRASVGVRTQVRSARSAPRAGTPRTARCAAVSPCGTRRCRKPAEPGSEYCKGHQDPSAESERQGPQSARHDCAKCNDTGSYVEKGEQYTCVCKHGLGAESTETTCALCDDSGRYLLGAARRVGEGSTVNECPCKRGELMTQLVRQAQKAVAS